MLGAVGRVIQGLSASHPSHSAGGVPVLPRCLGGRVVAHGSGALPVQQRLRADGGCSGEAAEATRGFREVLCHVGGAHCRPQEADNGEKGSG